MCCFLERFPEYCSTCTSGDECDGAPNGAAMKIQLDHAKVTGWWKRAWKIGRTFAELGGCGVKKSTSDPFSSSFFQEKDSGVPTGRRKGCGFLASCKSNLFNLCQG